MSCCRCSCSRFCDPGVPQLIFIAKVPLGERRQPAVTFSSSPPPRAQRKRRPLFPCSYLLGRSPYQERHGCPCISPEETSGDDLRNSIWTGDVEDQWVIWLSQQLGQHLSRKPARSCTRRLHGSRVSSNPIQDFCPDRMLRLACKQAVVHAVSDRDIFGPGPFPLDENCPIVKFESLSE
jgi:hypothetical protein